MQEIEGAQNTSKFSSTTIIQFDGNPEDYTLKYSTAIRMAKNNKVGDYIKVKTTGNSFYIEKSILSQTTKNRLNELQNQTEQ